MLELEESAWKPLERRAKYRVKTKQRQRPENVKKRIVKESGYKNLVLESEHIAEFRYRPTASKPSYRMIVLRKNLSVQKGEKQSVAADGISQVRRRAHPCACTVGEDGEPAYFSAPCLEPLNRYQHIFIRAVERFETPLRC